MSVHLGAKKEEIAEKVLLPGDPCRAKFIAENLLEKCYCYNQVRGMYGFTGTYKGKKVSIQGTGMGIPSISIYVHELINYYNAKSLIRIGTCGAIKENIKIRDIILAMSASTDSNINKLRFSGSDYAPTANFDLLLKAYNEGKRQNFNIQTGNVLTSDTFYTDDEREWTKWAKFGVLAVEMETSALYTLASKFDVKALSVLTVSDHIISGENTSSDEREKTFIEMAELALEII